MPSTATQDGVAAGAVTLVVATTVWVTLGPVPTQELLALGVLACTAALAAAGVVLLVTARTVKRRGSSLAAWIGCGLLLMTGLGGLVGELWRSFAAPEGGWLAAVPLAALVIHVGLDRASGIHHHLPAVLLLLSAAAVVLAAPVVPDVRGVADWEIQVLVCAVALASLGWRCARNPSLPDRYRGAVAWGIGALALASVLAVLGLPGEWMAVRTAVVLAGTTVILSVAWRWAADSGREAVQQVDDLVGDLAEHREEVLLARAAMHDARATLAGVRAALAALTRDSMSPAERRILEAALRAESDRLLRQLERERPAGEGCRLDEAIAPLVVTARERGVDVRYRPDPVRVAADADTVAGIVQSLIDNAAVHAPGATVRVITDVTDDDVHVSVVDDGPGIPVELRCDLFVAGTRGASSQGDGLGLVSALLRAERVGGELRLLGTAPGTWFRLRLPAVGGSR